MNYPEKVYAAEGVFEAVVSAADEAVVTGDPDALISTWNLAAERMYGYSADEAVGQPVTILFPPDLVAEFKRIQTTLRGGGQIRALRTRRRHKDGFDVPVSLNVYPVFDNGGKFKGSASVAQDLTALVAAEHSALTREARFDALLRHRFDAVISMGADGRILDAYFGGPKAFGYALEEMVGRAGWDFVHTEDRPMVTKTWEHALGVSGPQAPVEFRMHLANGSWGWAEAVISNALDDEAVEAMVINIRDVTLRRHAEESQAASEQRYRQAVEGSPDAIAIVDGNGRVSLANPSLGLLLGRDAHDLVDSSYSELGLPDPLGRAAAAPFPYASRSGAMRWLEVSSTPLVRSEGEEAERLIWIHDVTDGIALQERLVETERLEALGRFAGGVVHDFNNVLQVIRGQSELLSGSIPPGIDAYDDVEGLDEAVGRAVGLVDQLVAFARGQVLEPVTIDLNQRLSGLLDFCRRLLPQEIQLELALADGDTTVYVDPAQFDRVVVNLVLNGRDAIAGPGRITIETRPGSMPEDVTTDAVVLRIADTGCGMEPEVAARCLEPFFTTKGPGVGTGLGLSTGYGIIQQSGGSMQVDSAPGNGTAMTIALPKATASIAAEFTPLTSAGLSVTDATVLVVDDDPTVRSFAVRVLSEAGHQVISAGSAESAIAMATEMPHPVDLLLTDVHMPGLNGVDLARRMLDLGLVRRVVLMSGIAVNNSDEARAYQLLRKPISPADLLIHVNEALRRSRPTQRVTSNR
jgi:PAS domain S-box-containing protein